MRNDNDLLSSLIGPLGPQFGSPFDRQHAEYHQSLMSQYNALQAVQNARVVHDKDLFKKQRVMPHKPLGSKFTDYLTTLTAGDERK